MVRGDEKYDVIVIGGGHAGCEAFAAAARVGVRAALVTPSLGQIAHQPCNPAVGGPGKGHLVREVVALGGLMGRVTDLSGLQFRTLNRRKGPAVRATRVQTDSALYPKTMAQLLAQQVKGAIIEDRAIGLDLRSDGAKRTVRGVYLERRGYISTNAVVIATGTFLNAAMFVGSKTTPGGRRGAKATLRLARALAELKLPLIRLKTGTCPRLDGATIDTQRLEEQDGEEPPPFFDPQTRAVAIPQRTCFLTHTSARTHTIVKENMRRSALYNGSLSGIGPRYCPSIETKIERFSEKPSHQVFLEPEDRLGKVVYPSGLSTSLPESVQDDMIRSIEGLKSARIVQYGYAVEYDAIQPQALLPSLEVDGLSGLFMAGQVLGTSGYEEAAVLGLWAGANAALKVKEQRPLALARDQAYAGVMVDDLTTRGVDEPYRMFTSRAEFRLLLREDNADERLLEEALRIGLLEPKRAERVQKKVAAIAEAKAKMTQTWLTPSKSTVDRLAIAGIAPSTKPTRLYDYLKRPQMCLGDLIPLAPWLSELERDVVARLEVDAKYEGYLDRQQRLATQLRQLDEVTLPENGDFESIGGLKREAVEKLKQARPATLGQASRIPGITPAMLQILHVWCKKS